MVEVFPKTHVVFVYKKHEDAIIPQKATPGSIGFDVFALERVTINPGEMKLVRTGIVVQTRFPYACILVPRSSLFKKKGLVMPNSVGVIDFDYCGEEDEIFVPLYNLSTQVAHVEKGERIAQLLFVHIGNPWIEISEVPPQQVNRGGFGSTQGYIV